MVNSIICMYIYLSIYIYTHTYLNYLYISLLFNFYTFGFQPEFQGYVGYKVEDMLSHFSHMQPFVTLWTVAHQAPLSMGFSRQEYWCGLPFPSPGDLPNSVIGPTSLMSPALVDRFFTTRASWKALPLQL